MIKGKLCVFGCYHDSELYPRNRTLISALTALYSQTVEIRPTRPTNHDRTHRSLATAAGIFNAAINSIVGFLSLYRQRGLLADARLIYIPYPAYLDLVFLRLITTKKCRPTIAIDAFLCLRDTVVLDRKLIRTNGLADKALRWLEAVTMRHANLIFIDTEEQKQQLIRSYRFDSRKVVVTPVGIDESVWSPLPILPLTRDFTLLFWGTFIPLHGIETIISAAELLSLSHPNIKFSIIGDGQTAKEIASRLLEKPLRNLEWQRQLVSAGVLRSNVERAHCILGIFGTSLKAGNVIPYKAYQAMASNKILITRKGPAFSRLNNQGKQFSGLVLVPAGSSTALADAIIYTYQNYQEICERLETRTAYESHLSNSLLKKCVAEGIGNIQSR